MIYVSEKSTVVEFKMKCLFLIFLMVLFYGCSVSESSTDSDVLQQNDQNEEVQDQKTIDDSGNENKDSNTVSDDPVVDNEVSDPSSDTEKNDDIFVPDNETQDIDKVDSETTDEDTGNAICGVESPDPVNEDPLPIVADYGIRESFQNGGFTDHFLYSNTAKQFKIGVREQWGSSIVFFGFANSSSSNVIDANDTGREVQIAIYDPDRITQNCAWDATCRSTGSDCTGGITYLGWNPVQGGNRCNNGSPTESITGSDGEMIASVVPYQWNPAWDRKDCVSDICDDISYKYRLSDMRYIQKIRWVDPNIVEIKMTIHNLTDIERSPTLQEFPTLYVPYGEHGLQNYNVLLDSNGTQIAIDVPANDGFFMKNFESAGGWTTLQNSVRDYGVGIYYENRLTEFQGWQKDGIFNNVRSRIVFGLPANGTVSARAYLILGSFATVKILAEGLDAKIPPFGYADTPANDDEVSGDTLNVEGWVLDNKGVSKIEVFIDGVSKGEIALNTAREDVCKEWPGYSMCPTAGYSGSVNISDLSVCAYLVEIKATDTDSNVRVIAKKRIFKK